MTPSRTAAPAASAGPRLVRGPEPAAPPREWSAAALRVLEHRAGPLRVVGGPGTGKTTLLIESVARRIAEGVSPENVLLLVGSRRAAGQLRERLTPLLARDGAARTSRELLVRTVHSYAFGVLRLHAAQHEDPPPRLLASAEQDVVVRDLLAGEIANWNGSVPGSGWPERLDPALGLPGFAAELRELLLRAAERGLGPDELEEIGEAHGRDEWAAAGRFFRTYEQVVLLRGAAGRSAPQATAPALDSAELVAAALDALAADPELRARERARVRYLLVDDAQDLDPQQMELVRELAGSAQATLLAGDPDQAVLTFRGADPQGMTAVDAPAEVLVEDHRQTTPVRGRGGPAGRPPAGGRPGPGAPRTGSRVTGAGRSHRRRAAPRPSPRWTEPLTGPPRKTLPWTARPPRAGVARTGTPGLVTARSLRPGTRVPAARVSGSNRMRWRSGCSRRPRPRPAGSPTACAGPTWWTACPGRRWPCCPAPPAAPCPRCAGRSRRPACRSSPRRTSCRCPASRRSCRSC